QASHAAPLPRFDDFLRGSPGVEGHQAEGRHRENGARRRSPSPRHGARRRPAGARSPVRGLTVTWERRLKKMEKTIRQKAVQLEAKRRTAKERFDRAVKHEMEEFEGPVLIKLAGDNDAWEPTPPTQGPRDPNAPVLIVLRKIGPPPHPYGASMGGVP